MQRQEEEEEEEEDARFVQPFSVVYEQREPFEAYIRTGSAQMLTFDTSTVGKWDDVCECGRLFFVLVFLFAGVGRGQKDERVKPLTSARK